MTFKILLLILFLIIVEIIYLIKEGIADHKFDFWDSKNFGPKHNIYIPTFHKIILFRFIIKLKEVIPPIIKTAAKVIITPIKTPKKE